MDRISELTGLVTDAFELVQSKMLRPASLEITLFLASFSNSLASSSLSFRRGQVVDGFLKFSNGDQSLSLWATKVLIERANSFQLLLYVTLSRHYNSSGLGTSLNCHLRIPQLQVFSWHCKMTWFEEAMEITLRMVIIKQYPACKWLDIGSCFGEEVIERTDGLIDYLPALAISVSSQGVPKHRWW